MVRAGIWIQFCQIPKPLSHWGKKRSSLLHYPSMYWIWGGSSGFFKKISTPKRQIHIALDWWVKKVVRETLGLFLVSKMRNAYPNIILCSLWKKAWLDICPPSLHDFPFNLFIPEEDGSRVRWPKSTFALGSFLHPWPFVTPLQSRTWDNFMQATELLETRGRSRTFILVVLAWSGGNAVLDGPDLWGKWLESSRRWPGYNSLTW